MMMNKFCLLVSDRTATWGHWSRFLLRPSEDSRPIPLVIVFCVALGWKNHHHHHWCHGQHQHHHFRHQCHHQDKLVKVKIYCQFSLRSFFLISHPIINIWTSMLWIIAIVNKILVLPTYIFFKLKFLFATVWISGIGLGWQKRPGKKKLVLYFVFL